MSLWWEVNRNQREPQKRHPIAWSLSHVERGGLVLEGLPLGRGLLLGLAVRLEVAGLLQLGMGLWLVPGLRLALIRVLRLRLGLGSKARPSTLLDYDVFLDSLPTSHFPISRCTLCISVPLQMRVKHFVCLLLVK